MATEEEIEAKIIDIRAEMSYNNQVIRDMEGTNMALESELDDLSIELWNLNRKVYIG